MSVKAVARVWERSAAKGSELLVLLAIADYAQDDGRNAWPSQLQLATKSRMTERGVRLVLRRLVAMRELAIERNTEGREVLCGQHRPRAFMHVLCCVDGWEPGANEPEKISGATGKDFRSDRNKSVNKPERERTPLKEGNYILDSR